MKIATIDAFVVSLPFRFAFGHSLASRRHSENVIVAVGLDDGTVGYGEGIPRDYVTGESVESSLELLQTHYAPRFVGVELSDTQAAVNLLQAEFENGGLRTEPHGATWCALELAILDAVARRQGQALSSYFNSAPVPHARYGAVVPFVRGKALAAMLYFYKLYGFSTVKLKLGRNFEEDVQRVALSRKILGPDVTLRVDANCAWSVEETLRAAQRLRPLGVVSIEQPLPAHDWDGLCKVTADLPENIIVDESLCTLKQATGLAQAKTCNGFNIRISKVGGLLVASEMVRIAKAAGIECHMGAQVGESGILSAAGRIFACAQGPFVNCEGSDNLFLLKQDLTAENLTVGFRGYGKLLTGNGLAVTVLAQRLQSLRVVQYACSPARKSAFAVPKIGR